MRTKKWFIMILSGLLIFASFPLNTWAEDESDKTKTRSNEVQGDYSTKDEVIYGNLDAYGKTEDMYVVNTFHVTESGEIIDYGDYTDVRNLTNLSDIEQMNNEVHFQAKEKEFYYQGQLDYKPLPWDISITYLLDGQEVSAENLAGQSGDFEIQLTAAENKDVDPVFFENYLLQISMTLDPEIFTDIQAPEGTEANEGKNKQISFMVLPGQEEELILTADVTDFEMDPIDISAIPANIAIDNPDIGDMTGDMESLSDAIVEINNGVADLSDGISDLNTGAKDLSDGSTEYRNGINELDQSSGELVKGSEEIRDVFNQIDEWMVGGLDIPDIDADELKKLPDTLRDLANVLKDSSKGLDDLKKSYDRLAEQIEKIPDPSDISQEDIKALRQTEGVNKGVVDELAGTYFAAQAVKKAYLDTQGKGIDVAKETLEEISKSISKMADQLDKAANDMETSLENMNELESLTDFQEGLSTLSSEYTTFHNGLVDYTEGVNQLATNYQELDSGIEDLSEGTSSLNSGISELHEGTQELQEETSDIPSEMQDKIDELMEDYDNPDFKPKSFVSEENKHVDVVQFVLQTEAIEIEEPEETDDVEEEDKSLWDRFLDLFR